MKQQAAMTEDQIVEKAKEMTKARQWAITTRCDAELSIDEENDNNRYTALAIKVMMLPEVDLNDPVAVQNRVADYFQMYAEAGIKPTVNGLCNSIGLDRRRLLEIATDQMCGGHTNNFICSETRAVLKKAYKMFAELHESYMQNGKINPVTGIFLAKNHFGYQDKVDYVITPNTKPETDFNEADITKRYLTGGENGDSN